MTKKSFIVSNNKLQEIEYSSGKAVVGEEDKSELLDRDYKNYIDFKLSFDELNFKNNEEAIEKLQAVAEDISKIEIKKNNKSVTSKKQMRIDDTFHNLNRKQQRKEIENFVEDQYKDSKVIGTPEIKAWEITQDGWGNDVVKMKIKKYYKRTQSMNNSIISIHTKSRDEIKGNENYKVKPHIHVTIDRNNDWGKKYAYLKQELSQVIRKHNLTSSHNVDIKRDRSSKEYKEYRILKDRLSSFSWVVNKHEEGTYIIKQLQQYEKNEKSVKLNNVEEKLNRYIELGGSYDFARKLQTNLKEKLSFEIEINEPISYKKAAKNIEQENYKQIINEVRSQALNGERISEKYKEFAKKVLSKDEVNIKELATARGIQAAVKNRGYHLDRNFNKVIDRKKINKLCDKEIKIIDRLQKKEQFELVKHKVKERSYLVQSELRKELKTAGIKNCKKTFGVSEVALIFQGNEKYIRNRIPNRSFNSIAEVRKEIDKLDLDISDNWKEKIAEKIHKDRTPIAEKQKELKEIDTKLRDLKQQRTATRANLKRLHNTCKRIGFELKNLTGGYNKDELLDEINESSDKIKAGISILMTLYKHQHQIKADKYKKVKNIYSKESKKDLNEWDKYFTKEKDNIEKIETAAKNSNIKIKDIKKLQKGYQVTVDSEVIKDKRCKIKFKIEDSEAAINAIGIKQAAYNKINESDQKINQYPKKIIYESEKNKIENKIKNLKKEKENINTGGLIGKITGKSKKAKTKKQRIEKKIAAEKAKLNKLDKKINKVEKLKKERLEYFDYIDAADIKLKELKNKTKESKIRKIHKRKNKTR
jgi:hypothetical protein